MNFFANLLASVYMMDLPKIKTNIEQLWSEYQQLLDQAEQTNDLYITNQARAYLYFLGYIFIEDFAKGAIERRLRNIDPPVSFDEFISWLDSGRIPEKYKHNQPFQALKEFYSLLKKFKNINVNGSYLDEDRFNKIFAKITNQSIKDVAIWEIEKEHLKTATDKTIKGITASKGKCQGKAFVIEDISQIANFPSGHILITAMTTPDYLPAMKKAIGIATDFGGILSHPAIISRELEIPCVVGAKNVSRTVKNDDLVELNANEGYIKILS